MGVETRNLGGGAPALLAATLSLLGSAPGERVHLSGVGPQPYLPLQAQCMQQCCHLVVTLGHCPESLPLLRWGIPGRALQTILGQLSPHDLLGQQPRPGRVAQRHCRRNWACPGGSKHPGGLGSLKLLRSQGWCPWQAAWSRGCSAWKGYHPWQ